MQPYLFPYIGYFQLISATDAFVIYDDVNFIKQGWINRNRLLVNSRPSMFSVPLDNAGSFRLIKDIGLSSKDYLRWKGKFFRTMELNYKKAPYYEEIMPLVESVFNGCTGFIGRLALDSIRHVCKYLDIRLTWIESSSFYDNRHLIGAERVIDICRLSGADMYINAIGGRNLYDKKTFEENGIVLKFIRSKAVVYSQYGDEFVPDLSIIDVLMFNSKLKVKSYLGEYELI